MDSDSRFAWLNRRSIAWALYDCGNSAFALSSIAVLFPLFIGSFWSAGAEGTVVTSRLAWTTAAASAVVLVMAPLLGALADSSGRRKRMLFVLGLLGALSTVGLGYVAEGDWRFALTAFFFGSIGFYSANVIYDSLIVEVSRPGDFELVSALGYSLGYIGSALLLTVHVWMMAAPATFGFSGMADVVRVAFVSVGAWWFVFLLPLMAIVPEPPARVSMGDRPIAAAYRALIDTARHVGRYREIVRFLVAYTLYIAGVFTVIVMAVNFGQRLGFDQVDLVKALLITNFVGFPATLFYGYLGNRIGARAATLIGLSVYASVAIWAVFLESVNQFYVMALLIGLVQGGVQAMSRSIYAGLIPDDRSGEFFGFYNMLTKLAHVLGPVVVGFGALLSDDPKSILIALMPLYLLGAFILMKVPAEETGGSND